MLREGAASGKRDEVDAAAPATARDWREPRLAGLGIKVILGEDFQKPA